jgi:hypothetical protein
LTPLRSQAASAVCARDPEIEVGPRPQDQTAVVGILVYKLYSLGEFTKRVPYHLRRYNKLITKYHGNRGEYGIIIPLTGVPVAARFNQAVRAWRRNVMYQP